MPEPLPTDIHKVFQDHPRLMDVCGMPRLAEPQDGLTNRVYRLTTEKGAFYLRVPRSNQMQGINREVEAWNLALAAGLGLARAPIYCDTASGILLTEAVETIAYEHGGIPALLGKAVGTLHASGAAFGGELDPGKVCQGLRQDLCDSGDMGRELAILDQVIAGLMRHDTQSARAAVPSHCDLSPGNCLMAPEKLWLIDWEYAAMSEPAWDIAYCVVEHGFSGEQEHQFLDAYRAAGAASFCPGPERLQIMKVTCDAISALWALVQVANGRESEAFQAFAQERAYRAAKRLQLIS